jgi:hypothetical protein
MLTSVFLRSATMRSERGDQVGYAIERASRRGVAPEVAMRKSAKGAFPV